LAVVCRMCRCGHCIYCEGGGGRKDAFAGEEKRKQKKKKRETEGFFLFSILVLNTKNIRNQRKSLSYLMCVLLNMF
jgi:histone acetyltransferase (RNA polymerase elongator complex component)